MADLIDLNSPENKITQTTLPSPLIPPPQNDSPKSGLFNLSDTRKSMDNNPFDLVHRKTVEYVSKLSDPFESVFHKATSEPENSQGTSDDLLLRKKRYSNLMELNRMLDESTTDASGIVDIPKSQPMSILPTTIVAHEDGTKVPSIIIDPPAPSDDLSYLDISAMDNSLRSLSDCRGNLKQPPGTSSSSDNLEKSLLSNSAMNDTLSMSGNSTGDEVIKLIAPRTTSMSIQNVVQNLRVNELDKNYKMRRSFSQGDGNSPMKFRKRSLSTIDRRKIIMSSDSSVASILYEDPINLGFISRSKNDYSIGNDLSQLSAITGLDSANYMSCFTSISNDTANKGFIDSYSGGVIGGSEGTRSRASDTSMQDLIAKYKSLRSKSMIECGELRKKNIESQRQSDHEGSDSVFVDDHEERIIFSEANLLAKTFEDLATKSTKSSGSGEDLSNIQLPSNFNASPETSALSYDVSGVSLSPSKRQVNTNMVASSSNTMEIPMDSVKKEAAFNILRDLEKAAQTKNNPEIMKLLETLGKALGVTTENNLSLSTMYHRAQSENDDKLKVNSSKMKDQKSPKKNLRTIETSPENNNKTPIKESPKKINDMSMKKINIEKTSPKASIVDVSKVGFQNTEENDNESESNNLESEKSSEDNTELPHDLACSGENINVYPSTAKASKSTSSPPQDSFNTQKLILDIQLAVGKFLENCTVEPALVLENLNKVLTSKITAKQLGKSPTSSRKSDLTNRAIKSLDNSPELAKNHQKTTKSLSPRRRSSISLTTDKSRSSHSKRIDSPKKDAGKRGNISAPGIKGTLEKAQSDLGFKLRSTVPVVDKVKLRMKNDNNLAVKRGPMKALVPLGKMQRNGSRSSQCMPPGTPPRKERIPSPLKIKTSTPNPSPIVLGKKTTRSKPVASSTPVIVSKSTSDGSHVPTPSEKKLSWNISPVTPNVDGDAKNLYNNTATPNKQENSSQTPRKLNRSSLDRRIKGPSPLTGGANRMKDKVIHGRRSEPLQFLSPKDGIKTSTVSPLKEKNAIKAKPLNLNSKFRCRSGSLSGWEKENQV